MMNMCSKLCQKRLHFLTKSSYTKKSKYRKSCPLEVGKPTALQITEISRECKMNLCLVSLLFCRDCKKIYVYRIFERVGRIYI